MKLDDLVAALDLPQSCRVDQRVPKKLLIENSSLTSKDRRQVNENIEGIQWLAALKPNSVGVSEYKDDIREYLEIAILVVKLRESNRKTFKIARLLEILHRAIPYPVFLLIQWEQKIIVSLVHKRMAQNEVGKVVLEGNIVSATIPADVSTISIENAFMESLALRLQPQASLLTVYEGWIDILYSLLVSKITSIFKIAHTAEQAAIRRQALKEFQELDCDMRRLRTKALREKQLARQVELNLEVRFVQTKMIDVRSRL